MGKRVKEKDTGYEGDTKEGLGDLESLEGFKGSEERKRLDVEGVGKRNGLRGPKCQRRAWNEHLPVCL